MQSVQVQEQASAAPLGGKLRPYTVFEFEDFDMSTAKLSEAVGKSPAGTPLLTHLADRDPEHFGHLVGGPWKPVSTDNTADELLEVMADFVKDLKLVDGVPADAPPIPFVCRGKTAFFLPQYWSTEPGCVLAVYERDGQRLVRLVSPSKFDRDTEDA